MYTRDAATAAATGATTAPQPFDSRATPVANAAADAECPDGKDVVNGCRFNRRITGTRSSIGRSLRTAFLATVLIAADARASEATPRSAALRDRALVPSAAMPAAAPNHSTPWFALRLSRGRTRSAPGQCRSATVWNAARSYRWSRACQDPAEGSGFEVDMAQRIPCRRAANQEARTPRSAGNPKSDGICGGLPLSLTAGRVRSVARTSGMPLACVRDSGHWPEGRTEWGG